MNRDGQYRGSAGTPIQRRKSLPPTDTTPAHRARPRVPELADEDGNPDAWNTRTPTSTIRRTAYFDKQNPKRTKRVASRTLDRSTLMIMVSLLILVMVGGWWIFSLLANWWTNWQDDLHYGTPRTFQVDQFVGQGDSPTLPDHFIVVNLNGRVVVVQLNLAHPELDHTYGITTTDPKNPVSLTFRQTGTALAMYVIIGDTTPYTVELVSNGKQFVSPN